MSDMGLAGAVKLPSSSHNSIVLSYKILGKFSAKE